MLSHMNASVKTPSEIAAVNTLVVQGHAALTAALGVDGALQFMRHIADTDAKIDEADGTRRGVVGFDIDEERREVVLSFTVATTWMRFSAAEARDFARCVVKCADALNPKSPEN